MTIKKSLISVAASAAIIAAVTGCSSNGTTAATTTTTASGIQSAVTGVDGYIYNALVKAYYVMDDNVTMGSVTLAPASRTTNDLSTSPATVAVGSAVYSLADTNTSIKDRIKFFTIADDTVNADKALTATSFVPASYIESGADETKYDANDTLLGTTVLYAPATSSIVSPLSSLVYYAAQTVLGTTTTVGTATADLNTSVMASLESNATKIATNLGLSGVNLLTADAVELAATNPTFKLVNALLKQADANTATSILAATPATSLATTIANIAAALPTGTGKTLATSLQTMAENGALTTAEIAGMNIEKSVENGTYTTKAAPSLGGKFVVSGITSNSIDTALLSSSTAAGAKYSGTDIDINMTLVKNDQNISNTAFNLFVKVVGAKDNQADDVNNSSSIVAKIPFDLNLTDGTVDTTGIAVGAIVSFQAKSKSGNEIVELYDNNASSLGLTTGTTNLGVVATNILRIKLNDIVDELVTRADANLTTDTDGSTTSLFDKISSVSVAIEDATGAVIGASSTAVSLPLAKTTFSDFGLGKISSASALKVLESTTLDARGATTAQNDAPTVGTLAVAAAGMVNTGNPLVLGDTNATLANSNTLDDKKIIINKGKATTATLIMTVPTTSDSGEVNNSVTLSDSVAWLTPVAATLVETSTTDRDFNITIDTNSSAITAETEANLTITVTDEFGKVNTTDTNLTFFYNLAPVLTTKAGVSADANTSRVYAGAVSNFSKAITNGTATTASQCDVTTDGNMTTPTCAVSTDGDLTIGYDATGDYNTTGGWYAIVKMTDAYGATSAEYNCTISGITATGN